ncbi:TonB-dependent receptor plug domain-containing protein [Pedobacter heparinus]|uniref:TonB-dependent receptor plug domain-containing protein n=1 Tax=Pedobacter heparinus TaxID=984 RepID=UPI0029307D04|nr:TonB-dependent receptor plug domain-containing protein [Pedobacter heparinus]
MKAMMKKRIKSQLAVFASLILVFFFSVSLINENEALKAMLSKLELYRMNYPQEKVQLHLDKPFYATGDNIWFKAYVVTAESHQLSELSKILNVELINEKDSISQSLRLPLTNGITWGDFQLPDSLQEGNYRIRAYTNYMRNFGDDYFFDRTIQVGNPLSNKLVHPKIKKTAVIPILNQTDVQFFPEGGNQVCGISSKVAFKAMGADGLGKNVTGYLSDSNGKKILEFKSEYAGMGVFSLQQQPGQTYTATVKFPDGNEKKLVLPKALEQGFVLGATNLDSTYLSVKISASPAMIVAGGQFTLVAQSNSVVKFVSTNKLNNSVFSSRIPKSRFSSGILQLTLFDQQNQPVAERLVFINHNNDVLKVTVKAARAAVSRKKMKMEMEVQDASGKPVFGSFSVSVTDATKVPADGYKEKTILNNLLLTSDIKGYVEQPNYYFTATDPQKVHELDNLMMTQGWRRFTWKKILAGNFPQLIYKPEDGIHISGRVTQGKKPVPGGKVTLLSSKENLFVIDTLTDNNGRFVFKNLVFPDSTNFVVQARTAQGKKFVDIKLDNILPQGVAKNKNLPETEADVNKKLAAYLQNNRDQFEEIRRKFMLQRNNLLAEVKIVKRLERKVKGSANIAASADAIITGEELENGITVDQVLQGRVAGLMVRNGTAMLMRSRHAAMGVILDGVRMPANALGDIYTHEVEAIEVLKGASASIYGMTGFGGVLIITTKFAAGKPVHYPYTAGLITYSPKAYTSAREFYMPNYDEPKSNQQLSDLRTTIFWHPNIIVKGGKASFEYFNADSKGPYKVTIEGIDGNGKLARQVDNYTVN